MIYTVGVKKNYLEMYAQEKAKGDVLRKAGRDLSYRDEDNPNGFYGGSVWQTIQEARQHRLPGFAVFGVLADWEKDTAISLEPDADWHDLLVNSEIVILPEFPTRVAHCKRTTFDVFIGRPSPWGNPFSHKPSTLAKCKVGSREEAIQAYDDWLAGTKYQDVNPQQRQWILDHIYQLKGAVLGCFCFPQKCHGNILARLADNT